LDKKTIEEEKNNNIQQIKVCLNKKKNTKLKNENKKKNMKKNNINYVNLLSL